jgi:hypothetical protein
MEETRVIDAAEIFAEQAGLPARSRVQLYHQTGSNRSNECTSIVRSRACIEQIFM